MQILTPFPRCDLSHLNSRKCPCSVGLLIQAIDCYSKKEQGLRRQCPCAFLNKISFVSPPAGNVKFIDYEYAGYNYQAFDIGNHFNEFAGLNEVDYTLYPSRELQLQWLRAYLEAYKEYKSQGKQVSNTEVEVLYVQVNRFALASHFFWGLWALIQAQYSTIDFDFLGYAVLRFNQYFKMKPEVTSLHLPE